MKKSTGILAAMLMVAVTLFTSCKKLPWASTQGATTMDYFPIVLVIGGVLLGISQFVFKSKDVAVTRWRLWIGFVAVIIGIAIALS